MALQKRLRFAPRIENKNVLNARIKINSDTWHVLIAHLGLAFRQLYVQPEAMICNIISSIQLRSWSMFFEWNLYFFVEKITRGLHGKYIAHKRGMSLRKRGGGIGFFPENNNNGTPVAPGDRKYAVRISTQTSPHPPSVHSITI